MGSYSCHKSVFYNNTNQDWSGLMSSICYLASFIAELLKTVLSGLLEIYWRLNILFPHFAVFHTWFIYASTISVLNSRTFHFSVRMLDVANPIEQTNNNNNNSKTKCVCKIKSHKLIVPFLYIILTCILHLFLLSSINSHDVVAYLPFCRWTNRLEQTV